MMRCWINGNRPMNVWAIADLHLSFARPDRRERYAGRWRDHAEAIGRHWREVVRSGDVVLLPGDLSMARNHRDLQPDLAWIDRLPGTKVLSAGNHDAWVLGPDRVVARDAAHWTHGSRARASA